MRKVCKKIVIEKEENTYIARSVASSICRKCDSTLCLILNKSNKNFILYYTLRPKFSTTMQMSNLLLLLLRIYIVNPDTTVYDLVLSVISWSTMMMVNVLVSSTVDRGFESQSGCNQMLRLVFAASPLSTHHNRVRTNTFCLGISIMFPS